MQRCGPWQCVARSSPHSINMKNCYPAKRGQTHRKNKVQRYAKSLTGKRNALVGQDLCWDILSSCGRHETLITGSAAANSSKKRSAMVRDVAYRLTKRTGQAKPLLGFSFFIFGGEILVTGPAATNTSKHRSAMMWAWAICSWKQSWAVCDRKQSSQLIMTTPTLLTSTERSIKSKRCSTPLISASSHQQAAGPASTRHLSRKH